MLLVITEHQKWPKIGQKILLLVLKGTSLIIYLMALSILFIIIDTSSI